VDDVGNSVSQDPAIIDSSNISQQPRKVASLRQLYRVLLLKVKLVVTVAGRVDFERV
jgi:hypothetical protein